MNAPAGALGHKEDLANLATKADLAGWTAALSIRGEIKELRAELREEALQLERRIDGVESALGRRIDGLEHKIDTLGKGLTIRLGWMIAVAVGLTATLVKLL